MLDGIDGLILTGGPDLDPALYGAELQEGTDEPTPERRVRDAFELALLRGARGRAACRCSASAAACSSSTSRAAERSCRTSRASSTSRRTARSWARRAASRHDRAARVTADVLGAAVDDIHSHHHQGIAELGKAWSSGRAHDGTSRRRGSGAAVLHGRPVAPEEATTRPARRSSARSCRPRPRAATALTALRPPRATRGRPSTGSQSARCSSQMCSTMRSPVAPSSVPAAIE